MPCLWLCLCLAATAIGPGCGSSRQRPDPAKGAPPPPVVERARTADDAFKIDRPERFRLVTAAARQTPTNLTVSGTIIDNNIPMPGLRMTSVPSPHLWAVCEVYQSDLSLVKLGASADIRRDTNPQIIFKGLISNIIPLTGQQSPMAMVRLELVIHGGLPSGIFVHVTFHGRHSLIRAAIPPSAVSHLASGDWVYVSVDEGRFKRLSVVCEKTLPDGTQEVTGIDPGQKVVQDALALEAAMELATQ
jgi:hypothetical protein